MRILLFLGVAVLFTLAFADPKQCHPRRQKGGHHKKHHHQYHKSFHLYEQGNNRSNVNIGESLLHLGVQKSSYLIQKIPKHMPQKNALDYAIMAIELNYDSFHNTYKAMDDPASVFHPNDELSIFISKNRSPGNKNAKVIPMDFKNLSDAKTKLGNHVEKKTSGMIKNFFKGIEETTDAILISCADKWKLPVSHGTQYPVQLQGAFNALVEKKMGFTMVEIPNDEYINALFILPDEGREEEVKAAANKTNVALWRKSMTPQVVNVKVPRVTLYVCAAMTSEIINFNGRKIISYKYDGSMAATLP